jgi:ABC-type transport system substrate-binding protein
VGFEVKISSLDPIKIHDAYISRIIGQVLEGLVGLDEGNNVVPILAESWSSDTSGRIWNFQLRKGVLFHESSIFGEAKTRELKADDVSFSLQRILSKQSMVGFALQGVIKGDDAFTSGKTQTLDGVHVLGDYQIQIELASPDPLFVNRFTSVMFAVVPREIEKLDPNAFGERVTVGTGPFRVAQQSETSVLLEQNKSYRQNMNGGLAQVQFSVIENDQIRLAELRNGNLDLVHVPLSGAHGIIAKTVNDNNFQLNAGWSAFELSVVDTFNCTFLGMHGQKLDPNLRRAINVAINRKELVSLFPSGLAEPTIGPISHNFPGYKPPNVDKVYSPQQANSLIAAIPKPIEIEVLVHEKAGAEQIGQIIQSQLREVGIQVKLTKLDYNAVIQRMIDGNFDAFVLFFEYVYATPGPILEQLFHSGRIPSPNFWRYKNPEMDTLLRGFDDVKSVDEANLLTRRVVEFIQRDPPAAFLFHTKLPILHRKQLGHIPYNGHSVPLLWKVQPK